MLRSFFRNSSQLPRPPRILSKSSGAGKLCVSAEASFGLTATLIPAGFYCVKIALERDRSSLLLAAVPQLFGVQQFCEGLVWLGIGRSDADLTQWAALAYLFFAMAFWPVWIPLSAAALEPRRELKILLGLIGCGGFAGSLIAYLPLLLNPQSVAVTAIRHSIRYDISQSPAVLVIPQIAWHIASADHFIAAVSRDATETKGVGCLQHSDCRLRRHQPHRLLVCLRIGVVLLCRPADIRACLRIPQPASWTAARLLFALSKFSASGPHCAATKLSSRPWAHAFPREEFIPAELRSSACDVCPPLIGYDQTISQPFTVAFVPLIGRHGWQSSDSVSLLRSAKPSTDSH